MKITKKRLFDFCNENNDALNDLQSQSDSTDFVLSTLIDQLKDLGVIDKLGDEPSEPKLKQLDQSIFDGLDEKWRFAAVDGDGAVFLYMYHVAAGNDGFYLPIDQRLRISYNGYDTSNWQNSLIERDIAKELLEVDLSSELTGSDLCRAMLEHGDNYIMCRVGLIKEVVIINKFEDGWFYSQGVRHADPAPINNQGEPLTQSDVGL